MPDAKPFSAKPPVDGEDPFARADVLAQRLIEKKMEEWGAQNPAILVLYGKYKKPLNNFLSNVLGPAEIQHPLFMEPKKSKRQRAARAKKAKTATKPEKGPQVIDAEFTDLGGSAA